MTNGLKNGTKFTIGSCQYTVKDSTPDGFFASVVDRKPVAVDKDKKKYKKFGDVDGGDVDEETVQETFGKKDTKE